MKRNSSIYLKQKNRAYCFDFISFFFLSAKKLSNIKLALLRETLGTSDLHLTSRRPIYIHQLKFSMRERMILRVYIKAVR